MLTQVVQAELRIRRAQLFQQIETDAERYTRALGLLELAEEEIQTLMSDIRVELAAHDALGEKLRQETASTTVAEGWAMDTDQTGTSTVQQEPIGDVNDNILGPRDDLPKTPAGDAHRVRRQALSNRLRDCQLCLHRVKFFKGNVAHGINPGCALETQSYDAADSIRKNVLKSELTSCVFYHAHFRSDDER
jgi:E3 ubiquitin-protein ligase SHPRH